LFLTSFIGAFSRIFPFASKEITYGPPILLSKPSFYPFLPNFIPGFLNMPTITSISVEDESLYHNSLNNFSGISNHLLALNGTLYPNMHPKLIFCGRFKLITSKENGKKGIMG
jgi:hypothetical protein